MKLIIQLLVSGILAGFLYSLITIGLTLIRGVMKMVNFAHADFIMISMYIVLTVFSVSGLNPFFSLPLVLIFFYFIGVVFYKTIMKQVIKSNSLISQIFVTVGISLFLQGLAQFVWGADYQAIPRFLPASIVICDIVIRVPALIAGLVSLLCVGLIFWLINMTDVGRGLKAVSENKDAAQLMGIDVQKMYTMAMGISIACTAIAGSLLTLYYYIYPNVGEVFSLTAFVAATLGGFGNILGGVIGAIIVGIALSFGGFYIGPEWKPAIVGFLYILTMMIKPEGLLGKPLRK